MITLSHTLRFEKITKIDINTVINGGFKIELMLNSNSIDLLNNQNTFNKYYELLKDDIISVHAPAHSLNIGSKDDTIKEYSVKRILEGIEITRKFGAKDYIFHSTFMPLVPRDVFEKWIEISRPGFDKIINKCTKYGITPLIENTYEKNTELFEILFSKYKDIGFCLDIGHTNCFSQSDIFEWIDKFKNKICSVHVHDNSETEDSHLDLFSGNIDLNKIFSILKNIKIIRYNLETDIKSFSKNSTKLQELIK